MEFEEAIRHQDATYDSSKIEVLEGALVLRPIDNWGNHPNMFVNFNRANPGAANDIAHMFNDLAYDEKVLCRATRVIETIVGPYTFWSANLTWFNEPIGLFSYSSKYNNINTFSIDIIYTPSIITGSGYIIHEYEFIASNDNRRWALLRIGSELRIVTVGTGGSQKIFDTSGLNLIIDTNYIIRLTYIRINGTGTVTLSVNGVEWINNATAKALQNINDNLSPLFAMGGFSDRSAAIPEYRNNDRCSLTEIAHYNTVLTSTYTPRTTPLFIFTNNETSTWEIDSEFTTSLWDFSSLTFADETYWTSENLKLRYAVSQTPNPALSGSPITLAAFRALADEIGRYFKIEVTFITDGYEKLLLTCGKINFNVSTTINAPTITVQNDLTGTSFTCTINGDTGATHNLFYKKSGATNWTLWGVTRVDDGDIQVTGLDIARYDVIVYSSSGIFLSPPSNLGEVIVSSSAYTSIHELLYQLIKGDGTFQSLTGADVSDPRIYYFHPPEDIELSTSKSAYVTYFEESGAGIEDDRVYLAGEGDLVFRFDVWANNFDNMLAVWKAMRDIFNYLYYQYTGERLIKQIKLLNEAELFEQDTRIYRKSGTFLVRFIWQIQ